MSEGVLLMAYGTPATLDEVEAYFTHIRGGRTPSVEAIKELRARYQRIGGTSPLQTITASQAGKLAEALRTRRRAMPVFVGMKHAPPFIADAVHAMVGAGIRSAVALALAPHYSRISVAAYFSAAAEAAAACGIALRTIQSWHDHPAFIHAVTSRLQAAMLGATSPAVIFTAHSLPERILTWGDPYPEQLRRTCELVAAASGLATWRFAYQSASHTGEPWLGPDLLDSLAALAREGKREVVVCPIGFVADHLEVLYDIDVEAQETALELGLRLTRTASLNDSADFITMLADLIAPGLVPMEEPA